MNVQGGSDRKHIPVLDGLRGIAILLVMMFHSLIIQLDPMPEAEPATLIYAVALSGWAGVNLFFVLSGFLITGILLDAPRGRRSLGNFYARRALRILPLYYATLLLFFYVLPREPFPELAWHDERQILYWTYIQNWAIAAQGAWPATPNLNHLWSLNIEEQFYLVWPLLVFWLGRRRLPWLCALLIGGCLALRTLLILQGTPWVSVYVMTVARLDDLAVGCAIACLMRGPRGLAPLIPVARIVGGACLACVIGAMLVGGGGLVLWEEWTVTLGFSVISLGFGSALVAALSARPTGVVSRVLGSVPLRVLGKYSYALYVVHLPIVVLLMNVQFSFGRSAFFGYVAMPGTASYLFDLAATIGLSFTAAIVSWHAIERPFLRLKSRFVDRSSGGE